ncbi:hypothetical protein [Clostridium botulinum]|uniref:Conserved domain protein n=1 Tax=Clostridium botulinum (strain Langeland / NCTC 10281 / Type F) TaxID=441772 RepID=A7GEF6_CLOBL|nr:hypothetical protein [Clostridium botulinum]ABS40315.1 conserved domain protein [Clostridium botulinum F str. Langeland]ADF99584.1 conserved domain protein [Clostridium botulinum F str. 230613]KKM42838.1 hypothetical protein VT72_04145 [Clostridium botulinum]MBY6791642.1 hypothetical protein [Clostridium botulinum]MBY6936878.1 hypothetical protein [Clostridium botulinum]
MEKVVDVKKRYSRELEDIDYILRNLENGRYYENTKAKMDGYLATNVSDIRKKVDDLINKIEYNKDSIDEQLMKELAKVQNR